MTYVWPVLLVVFRALYFAYSLWCLLFPVAALWLLTTLVRGHSLLGMSFLEKLASYTVESNKLIFKAK